MSHRQIRCRVRISCGPLQCSIYLQPINPTSTSSKDSLNRVSRCIVSFVIFSATNSIHSTSTKCRACPMKGHVVFCLHRPTLTDCIQLTTEMRDTNHQYSEVPRTRNMIASIWHKSMEQHSYHTTNKQMEGKIPRKGKQNQQSQPYTNSELGI